MWDERRTERVASGRRRGPKRSQGGRTTTRPLRPLRWPIAALALASALKRIELHAVALRARIENDLFFASAESRRAVPTFPEPVFYAGQLRPPPETPLAVRAASTPMRFALIVFLIGWAGILFQAGIFQQIVFGAPVFEELAKLGPALIVVVLLRARALWIRVPLALASGAGFGVLEHFLTYPGEDLLSYGNRVAFHAVTPALSMLVYTALDRYADVRARWASTIPATLFHWANNFAAILFGFGALFAPFSLDPFATGWSWLVTGSMTLTVIGAILFWPRFEVGVRRALEAAMPKLGFAPAPVVAEERSVEDVQPL